MWLLSDIIETGPGLLYRNDQFYSSGESLYMC